MAIWALFALMTGAAVLAVLWPLSRRTAEVEADHPDAGFFRDQIAEIERDRGRGLLSDVEAEAARIEAARRLLRAADASGGSTSDAVGEPALRRRRAVSAIALSVVPILAIAIYGAYGSPHLPAQPLSARFAADPQRIDLAAAVAQIEAHLAKNPEDGRGWEVVAPVYLRTGRHEDAVRAYGAALRLLGETGPRLADYAEALVGAKDGVVSAEALAAFEKALAKEPAMPKARFYVAQAAEQDGNVARARAQYAEIMAKAPPEAAWAPLVRERLARLPSGAGVEAVAAMAPPNRQAAIRGMVEGLAARLEANGGSAEEWSRLVRSYAVLGEHEKAKVALARARQALGEVDAHDEPLASVERELNLSSIERKR
jgi:cytochrome c-type biogenesis protein CcmH